VQTKFVHGFLSKIFEFGPSLISEGKSKHAK
jgi:hypothetical protein